MRNGNLSDSATAPNPTAQEQGQLLQNIKHMVKLQTFQENHKNESSYKENSQGLKNLKSVL